MNATAVATKPIEEKGITRIQPMYVKGVEFISRDMNAFVDPGTTLEEVLHPEYWTHNAPRLREWGLIHCRWRDKTRYVLLMVMETGQTWAKTRLLSDKQFDPPATAKVEETSPELAAYKIQFVPNQGHRVVHKLNGTILHPGFPSKAEAETFLKRYIEDLKT